MRKALGWAAGRMGLWDKFLGDKGMTTQQSGPVPGIPQLPAKQRLQCSVPILDTVAESGCSAGLGSHLQVCWGGVPTWWVLVSFHCTEEQLEALRS